jgi:nicotinamide riboside transporter PnuC
MWLIIEWLAVFFAISGSIIMASKNYSHAISWNAWIMSNILFIYLFLEHTHQLGLLSMQIAGLFINIFGYWQWKNDSTSTHKISNILYLLSMLLLLIGAILMIKLIFVQTFIYVEWIGSLLGVSAALLLAAYHQHSRYCWVIWAVANLLLLILTLHTKQWGVVTLQSAFLLANLYGIWRWFINSNNILKPNNIKIK